MEHSDFHIGREFRTATGLWRCTDIGTRTIIAIRLEPVEVSVKDEDGRKWLQKLTRAEAEAIGWFDGPPYGTAEVVFDEDDLLGILDEDE